MDSSEGLCSFKYKLIFDTGIPHLSISVWNIKLFQMKSQNKNILQAKDVAINVDVTIMSNVLYVLGVWLLAKLILSLPMVELEISRSVISMMSYILLDINRSIKVLD